MGLFGQKLIRTVFLVVFALASGGRIAAQTSATWTRLRSFPEIPFQQYAWGGPVQADRDLDCLADDLEWLLASYFSPYFIFDSRENARRPDEPLTLFQVHTGIIRSNTGLMAGNCASIPQEVKIRYAYLHQRDGGYVTSPWCSDDHWGDNTGMTVTLSVTTDALGASRTLRLKEIRLGTFLWSEHPVRLLHGYHPVIYLSAGKHHEFADAAFGGTVESSPYSSWGCQDGVDGRGEQVWARLEHARAPRGFLNVGERHAHPSDDFVVDLTPLGFTGESAWGLSPFCGGVGRNCSSDVSPMSEIWLR